MSSPEPAGRIYVYSAPGYDVGWTGRPDPRVRIKEQTGTVYPDGDGIVVHLDEPAVRDDGTPFADHDVHKVLDAAGVQRSSEVVDATLAEVRAAIAATRAGRTYDPTRTDDFKMRPEQRAAVEQTAAYLFEHADDPQ